MIIPPGPLKVMVATKPVDFRKGAVSLAALVEHELGLKPFLGVVFIFRSKRANRIKLLVWDGTGLYGLGLSGEISYNLYGGQ